MTPSAKDTELDPDGQAARATFDEEFAAWQQRPLPARSVYAFADGTYFSVIYEGTGQKMPILALIGITPDGQREVIAFTCQRRRGR